MGDVSMGWEYGWASKLCLLHLRASVDVPSTRTESDEAVLAKGPKPGKALAGALEGHALSVQWCWLENRRACMPSESGRRKAGWLSDLPSPGAPPVTV